MTLLELQNLVSYWCDDLNKTYFTPTQLTRFLNNAQKEVQKKLILADQNYYTVNYQRDTVYGEDTYALPDRFYKIKNLAYVQYPDQVGNENLLTMEQIPLAMANSYSSLGTPIYFFLRQNNLVVRPIPDNTYRMRLQFDYKIVDLANLTDQPDIPEEFQEAIAIYAAFDCLVKDKTDYSALNQKKKYYDDLLQKASQERNLSGSRNIISYENDWW